MEDIDLTESLVRKPFKFELSIGSSVPSTDEERKLFDSIKAYLEANLYSYECSSGTEFNLPPTSFENKPEITYFDDFDKELHYPEGASFEFTEEQFENIWRDGTFTANSVVPEAPYVWKMSSLVCSGKENLKKAFKEDLSECFSLIYNITSLYNKKGKFANLSYSLKAMYKSMVYTVNLLFGLPYFIPKESKVKDKVRSDFDKERVKNNKNYVYEVFQMNFIQIYLALLGEFKENWTETKKELVNQGYQEGLSETEVEKAAENRKYEFFKKYLKSSAFPESFKDLLEPYLDHIWLYSKLRQEYLSTQTKIKTEITKEIKEKHQIRSRVREWFDAKFNEEYKKAIEVHDSGFTEKVNSNFSAEISKLIFDWQKYKKEEESQIKARMNEIPDETTYLTFTLKHMKPYSSKISEHRGNPAVPAYILDTSREIRCSKDTFGWKLKGIGYFLYSSCRNDLVDFYDEAVNSSFGVKGLFGVTPELSFACDSASGDVECTEFGFTFKSIVMEYNAEIVKNRADFFAHRDKSLFGGLFGNVFNWVKNYIFKGVLGNAVVIAGYPAVCVLNIALRTAFLLAKLPLNAMIAKIFYLFSILIFDFTNEDPRICGCFPLIVNILYFALNGMANLVLNPVMFVLRFGGSGVLLLLFALKYLVSLIYHWSMYRMVRLFGKIPKVRSDLAVPIEGPGFTAKIYTRIEVEDALLFLKVQLEKEKLEQFKDENFEILDKPNTAINKLNSVLSLLDMSSSLKDKLSYKTQELKQKLENQVNKRNKSLPSVKKVKFPLNELVILKTAAQEIIKDYVKEHNLTLIWSKYSLIEDTWNRLTDKLLAKALGDQVLEALEDSEVSLKTDSANKGSDWERMKVEVNSKSKKLKKMEKLKGLSTGSFLNIGSSLDDEDCNQWYEQEKAHYLNRHTKIEAIKDDFLSGSILSGCDHPLFLHYSYLPKEKQEELEGRDNVIKNQYLKMRNEHYLI